MRFKEIGEGVLELDTFEISDTLRIEVTKPKNDTYKVETYTNKVLTNVSYYKDSSILLSKLESLI